MSATFSVMSQIRGGATPRVCLNLKNSKSTMNAGHDIVLSAPEGVIKGVTLMLVVCIKDEVTFNKKPGWRKHKTVNGVACYTKEATGAEGSELIRWAGRSAEAIGFYMVFDSGATVHSLTSSEVLIPDTQVVLTASPIIENGLNLEASGYFNLVIAPA